MFDVCRTKPRLEANEVIDREFSKSRELTEVRRRSFSPTFQSVPQPVARYMEPPNVCDHGVVDQAGKGCKRRMKVPPAIQGREKVLLATEYGELIDRVESSKADLMKSARDQEYLLVANSSDFYYRGVLIANKLEVTIDTEHDIAQYYGKGLIGHQPNVVWHLVERYRTGL